MPRFIPCIVLTVAAAAPNAKTRTALCRPAVGCTLLTGRTPVAVLEKQVAQSARDRRIWSPVLQRRLLNIDRPAPFNLSINLKIQRRNGLISFDEARSPRFYPAETPDVILAMKGRRAGCVHGHLPHRGLHDRY
jgi:hypothetical protein